MCELYIIPLLCFFLTWLLVFLVFPTLCAFSPFRSSFFLHRIGLCPLIFFLLICSCVWIEPSNICLRRSLKSRKKRQRVKYSRAIAPEGLSQTRQQAWRAFALKSIVLNPVWGRRVCGGNRAILSCTWGRSWNRKGFMGSRYSKRKEIKLVWPVWRSTNCVSLKRTSKAVDIAVVD